MRRFIPFAIFLVSCSSDDTFVSTIAETTDPIEDSEGEEEVKIPLCGDFILDDGEECESGDYPFCTPWCTFPRCGDGYVQPESVEKCDDGNDDNTDWCTSECRYPRCGDGFVYEGHEECDEGPFGTGEYGGGKCTAKCQFAPFCGDGEVDSLEECDPEAPVQEAGGNCADNCVWVPDSCGDGVLQGDEECDDGNLIDTDSCINCKDAVCGDNFVWQGEEDCDDGNDHTEDWCLPDCTWPSCGDGFVSGLEVCDNPLDHNLENYNSCSEDCMTQGPHCGDGVIQAEFEDCESEDPSVCSPTCERVMVVFATQQTFQGDFGSVEFAHDLCQNLGDLSYPGRQFKAYIYADDYSPLDDFSIGGSYWTKTSEGYEKVSKSFLSFVYGPLKEHLRWDIDGDWIPGENSYLWIGDDENCENWSVNHPDLVGHGHNSYLLHWEDAVYACDRELSFVCVEQF